MHKPLPTSTASFRNIINSGYLYIDKTRFIYDLIKHGNSAYFLSRPRRFGKSLWVSTLEQLFLGHRELFKGLWIDSSDYEWEVHPVVRLDFNLEPVRTVDELNESLGIYLDEIAELYGINLLDGPYYRKFRRLIQKLATEKQVIILIDEYDKPMIDNLNNLDDAIKIRDALKSFYGVIKSMDEYIRLAFLTGVSKFSKVGVFSELNHLSDLTMNTDFATAVGLTEQEILDNFPEYITMMAQREGVNEDLLLSKMQQWYDGFAFAPEAENVYNTFSTLNFFYHKRFSNFWFESGTPTFLIEILKRSEFELSLLDEIKIGETAFSTYELDDLDIIPLLYQTGYLTIKHYDREHQLYTLSYPNQEVEKSFKIWLLGNYSYAKRGLSDATIGQLVDALKMQELDRFFKILTVFFANIPYDLQLNYEKYYQTIFYLIFMMMGFRIDAEVETNDGRIDAVIELATRIYLFEFKLNKSAEEAMAQIKQHRYYQKYQLRGKPIICIGANFDTKTRTVDDWDKKEVPA
ncbi:MAG: ATP-binding protein [Chloroflexota bacterium]